MRSVPANAQTSMNRVERGRWKLVKSRSTILKRYPGVMKMSVSPAKGRSRPLRPPRSPAGAAQWCRPPGDRKRVGTGTGVSVRVDVGGRRSFKKKKNQEVSKRLTK